MKLTRVAAAALLVLASACSSAGPLGPDLPESRPPAASPADGPSYDGGTVHGSGG